MKVSVITIVYNDVSGIERTITSVINQTAFKSIEYIIVDGASTDGTSDIINSCRNYIAKYICETDSGIYNAMNKGLDAASGDYIIFMNSGDKFSDSSVVEEIIKSIGQNNPDVVYGNYRETSANETMSRIIPCRHHSKIWYGPVASHQSTIYSVSHLKKNSLCYDESYKIAADYKLSAQAIKLSDNILQLDLCISDFDNTGVSSINQNLGLKEANRVHREVFGWNKFRIFFLNVLLLSARYTKKYLSPIYKMLRY